MSIDGNSYTSVEVERRPQKKKSKKQKNKSRWYWRLLRRLLLPGLVFTGLFALYITWDLPDINMIGEIKKTPSITIKAADGSIIGSYGDVYGDFIPYEDLPKSLVNAVVATEDRNFFHHFGVDPLGLLRAAFVNFRAHRVVQGGSTITQQLAKNAFLTPDRTMKRKLQEMILAIKLERRFSKKDILAMYLNRVYMGAGNYGVDAAAQRYFAHHVQQLTVPEAAMLVGLLKAPTRYTPTTNPDRSEKRATQVLLNMMDAGYLTQKQVDEAKVAYEDDDAVYREGQTMGKYYFTDYVAGQVSDILNDSKQDVIVTTTLLPDKQAEAEEAVTQIMSQKGAAMKAKQAALVSMSPDGAVRAMVGGRSYKTSQFNRATQGLRQPGSSFKLFVFLAALEAGYTPETQMEDKPITIGKWRPKDYTGKYLGTVSLRKSFAESLNSVAVQLSETVGRHRVIDMAERLGISETIDPNPSLALGTTEVTLLEMTRAYAHLASGGKYVRPYVIEKIVNTSDEVLYEHPKPGEERAISADVVAMMNDMLLAVTTSGTGKAALIGRPVAGKTGTASDYRDAWFIGFVPQLVTGVWVGNDDTTPMKKVTGGSLPASIFKQYMTAALKGVDVASIPSRSSRDGGIPFLPWDSLPSASSLNPFASTGKDENGDEEEPAPQYSAPSSFWDKLTGNE